MIAALVVPQLLRANDTLVRLNVGSIEQYTHTITAAGGFESCEIRLRGTLEDAQSYVANLRAELVVYGPDALSVWEGILTGVTLNLGGEAIDTRLDGLANAVKVRYQPDIGAQVSTAFAEDATSIATYGRKEYIYSGSGMTTAAAQAVRDALLAARAGPLASRTSQIGSRSPDITITLVFGGLYETLGWLTTSNTSTTLTDTLTQVATLITAYNTVNDFGIVTTSLGTSGVTDTEYIDADTTYREKIERLLSRGTSSGTRYAWGVYEDGVFRAVEWAGATPATIAYQRWVGDDRIWTPTGVEIPPWEVRPNTMYEVRDLSDSSALYTYSDEDARLFVERVTCRIDGEGAVVTLEPSQYSGVDTLLARLQ